jgi:ABC-type Mn2+/Zn2+ transport system ATPase subunit
MSGALVTLRDVSLGYDRRPVLEHVTLSIERGEFLALLGPNGAGKTTLLRGILGLIPTIAGRIHFGFDRSASPPGYVPQRDVLDPIFPLSAFEVVLMGTYAKLPPLWPAGRRLRRLAAQCLDHVGLAELADQPFWSLSGGQKQRVLIARALAVEPEIMLLDEPTSGVDLEAEATIIRLLTQLNTEHGLTVVLVTHHLARIRSALRSAVWIDEGRVAKLEIDAIPTVNGTTALGAPRTGTA